MELGRCSQYYECNSQPKAKYTLFLCERIVLCDVVNFSFFLLLFDAFQIQIQLIHTRFSLNELSNDDFRCLHYGKLFVTFCGINSNHSFHQEKCLRIKRLPTTQLIDFTLEEKVDTELSNKDSSEFFFLLLLVWKHHFPIGKTVKKSRLISCQFKKR